MRCRFAIFTLAIAALFAGSGPVSQSLAGGCGCEPTCAHAHHCRHRHCHHCRTAPPSGILVQSAPVMQAPVMQAPVMAAPVQMAPVQYAPVQMAPVQMAPVQMAPVQYAPVQYAPAPQAPQAPAAPSNCSGGAAAPSRESLAELLRQYEQLQQRAAAPRAPQPKEETCCDDLYARVERLENKLDSLEQNLADRISTEIRELAERLKE